MEAVDLRTAAELLGVHYQTAYGWVRSGELEAVKRPSGYHVTEEAVERLSAARRAPLPPPKQAHVRDWERQSERFYLRLVAGDETGARRMAERLAKAPIDVVDICEKLFAPVLHRIGAEWAAGTLSIAEEHRASAICERLLARMDTRPAGRPRGVCVVATLQGEEHGLPALMASVALRANRWHVHHLSTQVPVNDLAALARAEGAAFVVISATRSETVAAAEVAAAVIRWSTNRPVHIGGPGASLRQLVDAVNG